MASSTCRLSRLQRSAGVIVTLARDGALLAAIDANISIAIPQSTRARCIGVPGARRRLPSGNRPTFMAARLFPNVSALLNFVSAL